MSHSPAPWKVEDYGATENTLVDIVDSAGRSIRQPYEGHVLREDAERIVACVNFCRGIPIEWLQSRETLAINELIQIVRDDGYEVTDLHE